MRNMYLPSLQGYYGWEVGQPVLYFGFEIRNYYIFRISQIYSTYVFSDMPEQT